MSPRRPFADIKTMNTLFPAAEMEAGTVVRALEHMEVDPGALALAARQEIDSAGG